MRSLKMGNVRFLVAAGNYRDPEYNLLRLLGAGVSKVRCRARAGAHHYTNLFVPRHGTLRYPGPCAVEWPTATVNSIESGTVKALPAIGWDPAGASEFPM